MIAPTGLFAAFLPFGSHLCEHPLNLHQLLAVGLVSEQLQRIDILGFDSLFTGFGDHTALYPHLDPFRGLEIGAFWNEG
jgi:hypothetical protein